MTNRTYFIYLHRRHDTDEIFYVGKGTRTQGKGYYRAYTNYGRNEIWGHIVKKISYSVELIADFFLEDDAFTFERELIVKYGMRCNGGSLCNLTIGGDGRTGLSPSAETRVKLSMALSGTNHPNWGKKLSTETCRRKSESMKISPYNLRGKKLPKFWRDRTSIKKIGKLNPMYGKVGALHHNSRKVLNVVTGTMYDSVRVAAEANNYKMKTLYNWLSGHRLNPTKLEFA